METNEHPRHTFELLGQELIESRDSTRKRKRGPRGSGRKEEERKKKKEGRKEEKKGIKMEKRITNNIKKEKENRSRKLYCHIFYLS